jgi:DNA-binding transcriptional MerR regulator
VDSLISKKELLRITGISYGQLYRWKRKQIIPEEWFIKKSSYTGQETYFPKDKILARIERIKELKDDLSLDDIARMFSPQRPDVQLSIDLCRQKGLFRPETLDLYQSLYPMRTQIDFQTMLYLTIYEHLLQTGEVSLQEAKQMVMFLVELPVKANQGRLILVRKQGIGLWFLVSADDSIYFEQEGRRVVDLEIQELVEKVPVESMEGE